MPQQDSNPVLTLKTSSLRKPSSHNWSFTPPNPEPSPAKRFIKLLGQWVTAAPREAPKFDISRIIKYAPAELIGREDETKLLSDAWAKVRHGRDHAPSHPHLRSPSAARERPRSWPSGRRSWPRQDWPGCDAAFAWSFYSQGTRDQTAGFVRHCFSRKPSPSSATTQPWPAQRSRARSRKAGGWPNSSASGAALLILDGLEPLQYAPTSPTPGELKDQGLAALLKGLSAASHGLCVVTTRYSLPDLKAFWQTTAPEVKLLRLSMRGTQVLGLIAEGLSNREIAGKLGISVRTTRNASGADNEEVEHP